MMKMPALAVVGPDHRIVRSTETFRRRYEGAEKMCESLPEVAQVLAGHADVATVNVGELSVAIQAVTDATGRRQAMLTLPPLDPDPAPEPPLAALRDSADESPALVWVKDLDGRYLYANPRYLEELGTSAERLHGNTDADLPETETVDGPRLHYSEDGLKEPLQLEYTVPAIDRRPALAVFRFALRDDSGQPVATCGVAAPSSEARVARDEAVRLMQLERWNRLDPVHVRAELLEQWHVQAPPPPPEGPEPMEVASAQPVVEAAPSLPEPEPGAPAAPDPEAPAAPDPAESISRPPEPPAAPTPAPSPTSASAAPSLPDTAELLQTDLELARKWADRAEELQGELQQAQARIREAETDAQQARSAAARATAEADRCRGELEQARRELASLRGPSAAALRLSEELGRALAAERKRGDELESTLARLRARLTDFETVLDGQAGAPARMS